MEAFFQFIILILTHETCFVAGAKYYTRGSSWLTAAIVVPLVVGFVILVTILVYCKNKCSKTRRTGVMLSSGTLNHTYSEDSYELPPYKEQPPYGLPPPYEQPPPYRSPSAPIELATVNLLSRNTLVFIYMLLFS